MLFHMIWTAHGFCVVDMIYHLYHYYIYNNCVHVCTCTPLCVNVTQDRDGDTPLHCAILAHKHEAAQILLDAQADPSLVNFNLFNCVHVAAKAGVLP